MADVKKFIIGQVSYMVKDETAREGLASKQDTLVSGTNIKTINNQSLLGSGNITIEGGSGGSVTVDDALSSTSENPVQNKVINSALSRKQATLVSGTNIKTINNQSILGSGNITIEGGSGGSISVDSALDSTSENPVQNKVIKTALDNKQATLTFDNVPTSGSNNPVKSSGVYSAISGFKNITISSSSPTASDGNNNDIWIVVS